MQHSQRKVAALLLELGAPLEARMERSRTLLHVAVGAGTPKLVRLLIEHRADTTAITKDGHTPLAMAALDGSPEVLAALSPTAEAALAQGVGGYTAAVLAVRMGHADFLRGLVEITPRCLQVRVNDGQTLLMTAIAALAGGMPGVDGRSRGDGCGDPHGVLDYLLERPDADIHARSTMGATPLFLACGFAHAGLVRRLAAQGADVDTEDKQGTPAIHFAARHGKVETVRALHELGAAVHGVATHDGASLAVGTIASCGHPGMCTPQQCAELLLLFHEWGCSLTLPDRDGWTPAFLAASRRNIAVLQQLHELGVALDTPVTISRAAADYGHGVPNGHGAIEELDVQNMPHMQLLTPAMIVMQKTANGDELYVPALRLLYEAGGVSPTELRSLLQHGGVSAAARPAVAAEAAAYEPKPSFVRTLLLAVGEGGSDNATLNSLELLSWVLVDEPPAMAAAVIVGAMERALAMESDRTIGELSLEERGRATGSNLLAGALKAAHSLCGEGKLLRAELREAVLGAGLVRVVASAMRAFSEWEPVLTCGCAVLWCHNDGGCQEAVLQAGGVELVLEALMFGCLVWAALAHAPTPWAHTGVQGGGGAERDRGIVSADPTRPTSD